MEQGDLKKLSEETTIAKVGKDNFSSLTGYLNESNKRIDIVLVFKDDGKDEKKQMRLNFLMNALQVGLEAEVESGKMAGHRNLVFVKLHAPDEIIEQYGLYFNEKRFFKDSHLEFINPIFNIFGTKHERELLKIVRTHYPGPDNYSTLERSTIVYKLLLELPFGDNMNHYGINKLIQKNLFLDVFALHDGPYFIKQKSELLQTNLRQTIKSGIVEVNYLSTNEMPADLLSKGQILFYKWLGLINIWKTQPIHMIHEYFGNRVGQYMAFYEYFNIMLIILVLFSFVTTFRLYLNRETFESYIMSAKYICNSIKDKNICTECRNETLCPLLSGSAYCRRAQFRQIIDKKLTLDHGIYVVIWGIFFLIPLRYRERYLSWIWEVPKKHINNLLRPQRYELSSIIAIGIRSVINVLTAALAILWTYFLVQLSLVMWYYPRWKRLQETDDSRKLYKDHEYTYMAEMAFVHAILTILVKEVFILLALIMTDFENYKTFIKHEMSISIKLFFFCFMNSYTVLVIFSHVGIFYYKKGDKLDDYMDPFGRMSNGISSTVDEICLSVVVMTILEHVILPLVDLFKSRQTDYSFFCKNAPCWEREYKLKPITENFFHKGYHKLLMQFALLTCYSMLFPLASLCILIINLWDLRKTAYELLLTHRRPLLINNSGPGFWKILFLITAHIAPYFNITVLLFQSWHFATNYINKVTRKNRYRSGIFEKVYQEIESYLRQRDVCLSMKFYNQELPVSQDELGIRYVIMVVVLGVVLDFFLRFIIPATSESLEETIRKEKRIKEKYLIRKGIAN